MNLNRYTEKAQEAIVAAQQMAERGGQPEVMPEHVFLALVAQAEGIVPAVLGKMNVDPAALGREAQDLVNRLPKVQGGSQPGLSARLRKIFEAAESEAEALKDEFTSTEHIFLALAAEPGRSPVAQLLEGARRHERHDFSRTGRCPRFAARDRSEPGGQVSGAGAIRPRPHRDRAQGQARPGHRPRR
jgi:ATP-dependent Clp protease ATP-binding subunit ClpA